jgi:hypothetical protein
MKKIIYVLFIISQLVIAQETIITSKISKNISAEKIIKKYIKNIGGEENIKQIETLKKKFIVEIDNVADLNMTGEVLYKTPNLYSSELKIESLGQVQSTKYDGENCIMKRYHNNEVVEQKIDGKLLNEKIKGFYPFPILEATENNLTFTIIEKHISEKNTTYKLYLKDKSTTDSLFFFFDAKTYYLSKKEEISGKTKKITEYKEHKEINGIVFPFIEISTIEIEKKVAQKTKNQIIDIIINQPASLNAFQ